MEASSILNNLELKNFMTKEVGITFVLTWIACSLWHYFRGCGGGDSMITQDLHGAQGIQQKLVNKRNSDNLLNIGNEVHTDGVSIRGHYKGEVNYVKSASTSGIMKIGGRHFTTFGKTSVTDERKGVFMADEAGVRADVYYNEMQDPVTRREGEKQE